MESGCPALTAACGLLGPGLARGVDTHVGSNRDGRLAPDSGPDHSALLCWLNIMWRVAA